MVYFCVDFSPGVTLPLVSRLFLFWPKRTPVFAFFKEVSVKKIVTALENKIGNTKRVSSCQAGC
jgi:hypothetical protein